MAITLDEQAIELSGQTLGQVLEAAQQRLAPDGRIVVDVQIDGEHLAGDTLDQRLGESIDGRDVRLGSALPGQVAAEALEAVRGQLSEARVLQSEAADLLQRDQAGEALNKVTEAINAWLATQQVVGHAAAMLQIDLEAFEVDGHEVTDSVNELVAQLKELRELISAGDMVGLADALAYEWPEITDRWDAMLEAMIERAG